MAQTTKKLKDHHRAFLIREFACFATPMEASQALKQEYGLEITPQGAQHYDVTSGAGSRAAKKWHELFEVARKAFLEEVSDSIPLAHKSVRIKELARAANTFKASKNFLAMARILEQIAKEVGNVHTNKREFTGKDGGPIRYQDVGDMTDEQITDELRTYGIDPAQVHAALQPSSDEPDTRRVD